MNTSNDYMGPLMNMNKPTQISQNNPYQNNPYQNNQYQNNSYQNIPYQNNNNPNTKMHSKIYYQLHKYFHFFNMKNHIIRVFGTDALIFVSFLTIAKFWLKTRVPMTNHLFFREKCAGITLKYIHHTSSYFSNLNSQNDLIVYNSVLHFCLSRNIPHLKYLTNVNGIINFFDTNIEVKLYKKINISTKTVITNTTNNHEIELFSHAWTIDKINIFIKKCIKKYHKYIHKTTDRFINIKNQKCYKYNSFLVNNNAAVFDEYNYISSKSFNNIFFPDKEYFLKKLELFTTNRARYTELGIPYKFCAMLYGPPGCGKTSLIKAIANMTGRNLIEIQLSKIQYCREIRSIFYESKINNVEIPGFKRMYVFEDVDCALEIIKNRKQKSNNSNNSNNSINSNRTKNKNKNNNEYNEDDDTDDRKKSHEAEDAPFTLDVLLNMMDGSNEIAEHMIIFSTNRIDTMDPAFLRPGRIDCMLFLNNATPVTIIQIMKHFAPKDQINNVDEFYSKNKSKIDSLCYYNSNTVWSPASVANICMMYLDNDDYLQQILKHMDENYEQEIKLLGAL
jgi:hypothetical protein